MNQNKYSVEFTINIYNVSLDVLKASLAELGNDLNLDDTKELDGKERIVKIHIHTDDPHLVFDACSQFGRLRHVKVEEVKVLS